MKKIIIMLLLATMLTGCENEHSGYTGYGSFGSLLPCKTEDTLFYDRSTKIVYYVMMDYTGYKGYGFMSPYISKNGRFCRYIDDEIVEVEDKDENNN